MRAEDLEYPQEAFYAGSWEPAPRRDVRRLRVVAAVVVLALLLVGGGGAWVALGLANRLAPPLGPEVDAPRTVEALRLVTGNCVARLPQDGQVRRVRVVPCSQEHEAQVWSQFAFSRNAVWPGQDEAHARVSRSCQLPEELLEEGVALVAWSPTASSWQRGDRTGLCLAVLPSPRAESLFAPGTLGG